ncbi:DinB family protein [Actinophytocola glycyrrhizae]|uniref:DinB family protein n=1 Tax=Actinophytocola glycyrrhizae TaxID=2044873 RepID=A0ABV9S3L1_9PSEU
MTSTDTRTEPPRVAPEREQLGGFLDYLRGTVVMKAAGLTDEQARRALVPSELTTVAGLLAHLTYVEQYWFGVLFDGRPDEWNDRFELDPDAEFSAGMVTPLPELIENYERECAGSRAVAAKLDLDATATHKGEPVNLRWVLIHMIEETGRHAGHLDLLRELLDGSTGE